MKDIGRLIAILRKEKKISQDELAKMLNCTKQTVSNYERGIRRPDYEMLEAIADSLNVPMAFFLSEEEQQEELDRIFGISRRKETQLPAGAIPVKRVKVPLLGNIAAGEPITADQEYDTYVDADEDLHCDYALRIDGDSMTPTVQLGDLVFIRQQDDVDDGQIAAVLIDEGATLKRVRHIPNGLLLMSDNPKYEPMVFTFPDCDTIRILGKAVAFKRML